MDDYVIASIQIYLDVVILFLKILEILNEIMGKKWFNYNNLIQVY